MTITKGMTVRVIQDWGRRGALGKCGVVTKAWTTPDSHKSYARVNFGKNAGGQKMISPYPLLCLEVVNPQPEKRYEP